METCLRGEKGKFFRRREFKAKSEALCCIGFVDVLSEAAEVNRFSAYLCVVDIEALRSCCLIRKEEAVQDARFPRAVGAKDERERTDRNALRVCKGLEVGEMKRFDHDLLTF